MVFSDGGYQSVPEYTRKGLFFPQWRAECSTDSLSNLIFSLVFAQDVNDCIGSLPCSQQLSKSSWSLLCNAGPPSFQSSGGIPSTTAALPLIQMLNSFGNFFRRWLLILWMGAGDAEKCWVLDDTVRDEEGFQVLRPTTQNVGLVCKKHLPTCTVQGTLDHVNQVMHCLEGFLETSVVTYISVSLSSLCEIRPSVISDLWNLVLEDAANETEGSPPQMDITAEPGGLGWMISSSLAVHESLGCSRWTSLISSWW